MDLTDLRIFIEPQQGASYDDILGVAAAAERLGFGAFFRSDHYLKMGDVTGLPGPSDAWTTLAGLARDTSTIRLGTLVTSATFRLPGPLAITVAGVDQMSDGRVELGLGAGWFEAEHSAYGIPFPDAAHAVRPPRGAAGDHHRSVGARRRARRTRSTVSTTSSPTRPPFRSRSRPAARRSSSAAREPAGHPALAARYASEFNFAFAPVEAFAEQRDRVIAACESIDRDPATMVWSTAVVACAAVDEAGVVRRAAAIGRDPAELRRNGAAGTVDETAKTLRRWIDAGVDRIYLQILDLSDLEHLDVLATEVAPLLR